MFFCGASPKDKGRAPDSRKEGIEVITKRGRGAKVQEAQGKPTDPCHSASQVVNVGNPLRVNLDQDIITIHFHQFSKLPQAPNAWIESAAFVSQGLRWILRLYPRGHDARTPGDDAAQIGIYLCRDDASWSSTDVATLRYGVSIQKLQRTIAAECTFRKSDHRPGHGWPDFAPRRDVLQRGCVDDTLTLIVSMGSTGPAGLQTTWRPKTTFDRGCLKRLDREFRANIAFVVGHNKEIIKANTEIVFFAAPLMGDIIEGIDSDVATSKNAVATKSKGNSGDVMRQVELPNIEPKHFRSLLQFLYAQDTSFIDSDDTTQSDLRALIVMANQFGCCKLKLIIEAELCDSYLTSDTCIDLLLLADTHSCALLKDCALAMVTLLWPSLLGHADFPNLAKCEALLVEIHRNSLGQASSDEYEKLSVGALYEILETRGELDLICDMTRTELLQEVRAGQDG